MRRYFLDERDDVLLKVVLNCFSALQEVFREEWEKPHENILWKSTGFRGVMKSLPRLIQKGIGYKVLTKDYFSQCFRAFKTALGNKKLTSDNYGSGEAAQNQLSKEILNVLDTFQYQTS